MATTWLFKGAPTAEDLRDPNWRPEPWFTYEHIVERPIARRVSSEVDAVQTTPRDVQVKLEPESQPLSKYSEPTPRLEDSYANSYAATQAPSAALPHLWLFKDHEIAEIKQLRPGAVVQLVGIVLDIKPAQARMTRRGESKIVEMILGDIEGSSIKLTAWGEQCDPLNSLRSNDIVYFKHAYLEAGHDGPAPLVGGLPRVVNGGMQICWSATDPDNQPPLLATRLSYEEARVARLRDYLEDSGAL